MKLRPPEQISISALNAEVTRARLESPENRFLLAALMEEVNELTQALLQRRPREEWEKEAIQVACVAIRIAEEGDALFDSLTPEESEGGGA